MFGMVSKDIGIDLGTANTLLSIKGKGIVLREPTVVAINRDTNEVIATGEEAKAMLGRTPGNIVAVRPLKDGVIADFSATQLLLKNMIHKVCEKYKISKPRIVVCVPTGVTEVEERAVEESVIEAGGKSAFIMEEPMAAAIGAGLNVSEASGSMIVDIGGGTSEIAVISLGGIVTSKSIRTAGDELDDAIISYIKREFNLMIGERTAEDIKVNIGNACIPTIEESMEIRGRDLLTGLPKTLEITSTQIGEAMQEPIREIIEGIKMTLERTPPELSADVMEKGIVLAGGGALIKNLDMLISNETGMPVFIADNPLDCVVNGANKVLSDLDHLKSALSNANRNRR
ncbi:MAG: rod shape-determining protein [Clostridiales bacterium]|nr:rod shape-determining protein [Clostridiales bacterium]